MSPHSETKQTERLEWGAEKIVQNIQGDGGETTFPKPKLPGRVSCKHLQKPKGEGIPQDTWSLTCTSL